ncbi:MAG: hypothetical protein WDN24_07805 [Sphingomonas sp.]
MITRLLPALLLLGAIPAAAQGLEERAVAAARAVQPQVVVCGATSTSIPS